MRIKCTRSGTKALGWHGYAAEFDKDGFATVDKEVGEALVAAYPDTVEVVEKKTARKSSTEEE
jgi:hypothetical protein